MPPEVKELMKTNIKDKAKPKPKEEHKVIKAMNFFRALTTSWDASFMLRQGLGQIHTQGWRNSWKPLFKSLGSEKAFKVVTDVVESHPRYKEAHDNGVAFPGMDERMEEMQVSNLAEKIPGVRASARAYNAPALKMRMDNYNALADHLEALSDTARKTGQAKSGMFTVHSKRFGSFGPNTKYSSLSQDAWTENRKGMTRMQRFFDPDSPDAIDPRVNKVLGKQIAEMINVTSGRGNLGFLEKIVGELNVGIFSPRFVKSRMDMLNPLRYTMLPPAIAKEYAKSAIVMASYWALTAQLAKQVSDKVEVNNDPDSSDFGKIKIGNIRYDPPAGLQQYIVLIHRIASGERVNAQGQTKKLGSGIHGWPTTVGQFAVNKLAPIPAAGARFLLRTTGQPFEIGEEALKLVTPMTLGTLSEIVQEEPWLFPTIIPAALGVGTQTYDEQGNSPRLFGGYFPPEKYEKKLTGGGWFQ